MSDSKYIVHFSLVDEFLDELRLDPPPDKIVRLTRTYQAMMSPNIQAVSVVAGFVNRLGQVVEVKEFVGEDWGKDFKGHKEVQERGEVRIFAVRDACAELGLSMRAGRIEVGK